MAQLSKQALKVENNSSFPDNSTGYISAAGLRNYNTDQIDSFVDEIPYQDFTSSVNNSLNSLNAFTASQQPSFTALNSFTASQLNINSGVNTFTQSADGRLDALENDTTNLELFTASINEIREDGILQGYSTRLYFSGLISASIVPNVNGAIASIEVNHDSTKVNTSSFDDLSAEVDSIQSYTASLKTAISVNGTSASVAGNLTVAGTISAYQINTTIESSSVIFSSGSNILGDASSDTQTLHGTVNLPDGDLNVTGDITVTGNVDGIDLSVFYDSVNSFTQSNNTWTASIDTKFATLGNLSGSLATTGSNTFRGNETFEDAGGNASTIVPTSGSLMLVAKGFTSASSNISSSTNNTVNLIFKNNDNTADTILSGSNNIFTNFSAATTGFKRYVGGSNNVYTNAIGPQISSSMAFLPAMNRNIGGCVFTMRGPVSASTYTLNDNYIAGTVNLGTGAGTNSFEKMLSGYTFSNNGMFGGTINVTAGKTQLDTTATMISNLIFGATVNINHNSSSLVYNGNIQNGGITINNSYISASGATTTAKSVYANVNTVYGVNHALTVSGSNTSTGSVRTWFANLMAGANVTASMESNGDKSSMVATSIMGSGLTVLGTSTSTTAIPITTIDGTYGSLFTGRYNAQDGNKSKSAETVFAVGTGTSYTTRKTGFLIDSGSNTFIEGTLNVSGSTTVTGSVLGNIVPLTISSNTASMNLSQGNFFTLTLVSGSTTHLTATNTTPGQTINVLVTQSNPAGGSLTYNPAFKFAQGTAYTASVSAGAKDILTFVTFDSSTIYAAAIKNLV
jgi:hypothetical protein